MGGCLSTKLGVRNDLFRLFYNSGNISFKSPLNFREDGHTRL